MVNRLTNLKLNEEEKFFHDFDSTNLSLAKYLTLFSTFFLPLNYRSIVPPPQKKKAVILYKKATISLETKFGFFGEVLGFSFFL